MCAASHRPRRTGPGGPKGPYASPSLAHGPQLELERRELARHMQREAAAAFELLPEFTAALELEVVEAGMERQLAWRRGQQPQRHARQVQVHQIAQPVGRAE